MSRRRGIKEWGLLWMGSGERVRAVQAVKKEKGRGLDLGGSRGCSRDLLKK